MFSHIQLSLLSVRANDVTCGVDEHTMNVIHATFGTSDCPFPVIERQKVYLEHQRGNAQNIRFKIKDDSRRHEKSQKLPQESTRDYFMFACLFLRT